MDSNPSSLKCPVQLTSKLSLSNKADFWQKTSEGNFRKVKKHLKSNLKKKGHLCKMEALPQLQNHLSSTGIMFNVSKNRQTPFPLPHQPLTAVKD